MNKELEQAINNLNSSDVMEYLEHIEKDDFDIMITIPYPPTKVHNGVTEDEMFNTIKQYILKAQNDKKLLKVIKEKNLFEPTHKYIVDYSKVYATYSHMFGAYKLDKANKLTAEEFNLFKEWSKDE